MAVSYKKLLHLMIERDITNTKLMHDANISANFIILKMNQVNCNYRMKINVDLCEKLGRTIYSFPMKYHPISDPAYL